MISVLQTFGLRVHAAHGASWRKLRLWIDRGLPAIVLYREWDDIGHYAVVVSMDDTHITLHDPTHGPNLKITRKEFLQRWYGKHHSIYKHWFLVAQPNTDSIKNKKTL